MTDKLLLTSVSIREEVDVVACRQVAKQAAGWLGMSQLEQIRVATSVSELARNIFQYAGQGSFTFFLLGDGRGLLGALAFEARDKGPGIAQLGRILDGSYVSDTGMGVGLRGAQRLMDEFDIQTSPAGTAIRASKRIWPSRPMPEASAVAAFQATLQREGTVDPFAEIQVQGEELILTTGELLAKQQELEATNLELENTNKGVVALYSELEKTAQDLQQASESKSRFFSNMTHELRTPINIIENMSKMLLAGADGELNAEQSRQVGFISDAAGELSQLVNELLELAEAQSGRMEITPARFSLSDFMRQLQQTATGLLSRYPKVACHIELPEQDAILETDRNRLFQIMRNLISNAFKYTPEGQVTVRVFRPDPKQLEFLVEDTGVGIAEAHQARIFEEFARIRSPGLSHVEGTGLGLPLAKRLALVLGGDLWLTSTPGKGSRFYVRVPREYRADSTGHRDLRGLTVLIVDDNEADRYLIRRTLEPHDPVIIEAHDGRDSIDKLHAVRPDVVLLDLDLPDISGGDLLESMDAGMRQRVIVNTSKHLGDAERARLMPLCQALLDKSQPDHAQALLDAVERLSWSQRHEV